MADDLATLGFAVDTGGLSNGERALNSYAATGEQTEKKIGKSVSKMNSGFMTLQKTIGLATAALTAMGLTRLAGDVTGYADAWTLLNSQLRQVTESETELLKVRQQLLGVTRDTRSDLSNTVNLYAEMNRSTSNLNISSDRLIGITKTINNLFLAGGKAASETAGAIRQLNQGFAAGALRGDEFNSVAEGAPRIMDALGLSLKMSRGELREFAATGGITAEIMVDALEAYETQAQKLADKTKATFGQMMTLANTNATEFIGNSKAIGDAVDFAGESILFLSKNITSMVDAGKAFVAVYGVGVVGSLAKTAASTLSVTASTIAYNIQLAKMSGLTGAYAVQAGIATVATNALGVATKFLLGPWGLLITALGVAATAFMTSKNSAEELSGELEKQKTVINELEGAYAKMSNKAIGSAYIESQRTLIALDQKRMDLTSKILKLQGKGDPANMALLIDAKRQLSDLDSQGKKAEDRLQAIQNVFQKGIDGIKWVDPIAQAEKLTAKAAAAQQKWLDKVNGFKTPLEKLSEEIDKIYLGLYSGSLSTEGGAIPYLVELIKKKKELEEAAKDTTYQDWLDKINSESTVGQLSALSEEMKKVQDAMSKGLITKDVGEEKINKLKKQVLGLKKTVVDADIFGSVTDSINQSLTSMQGMSKQGSKEYKALGVAISATNAIQAVGAVLNQGNGDPYSAPARMAAMAASVAALGVQIGGLSGGIEDESKANQANQGLNVWGEKSESMSNSMEMIENASEKLVGINTNMLKALQNMQAGIAKAAGLIARDVETPQVNVGGLGIFDGQIPLMDNVIGDLLSFTTGGLFTKAIGKLLGGKSKVVDEGIRIVGGTIDELINDITIQAFQKVKYKKYSFSKSKSKTVFEDVTDQVGEQFSLVFESLADAVYIGATSLGFAGSDVEKAINDFEIATTDISLKGLSAEDQQKEINAVFSKIFDGMAKDVIDFLPDMQKVGEGLGETLSRVATQVNIAEVAIDSFGFKFFDKLANPEVFAKAADNLAALTGGVEEFAEKTSSFIDNFAPESVKLNVYSKSLAESLDAVGLTLPATSAGMFELMQSLDGTTEEGQKQIAALLNIQGTSKEYYNLLEEQAQAMVNLANSLQGAIDNIYGVTNETANMSLNAALAAARLGDLSKAMELDFNALNPSESDYSSLSEFNIAQAATASKLEELKNLTGGAVSIEDKTLAANEEQVKLLTSINNNLAVQNGNSGSSGGSSDSGANVVDLNLLLEEIKEIKAATEATAKSAATTADNTDRFRRAGMEVRIVE